VTDALGRSWQCGTCQVDFFMPERFDLSYTDPDDVQRRPVMIHRALLGSMERFVGILIEHHAGRFPLWLAPVQAVVLPVADRHNEQAARVAAELREAGIRVELDTRSESVGRKIRDAELAHHPYMLVVGDKEQEAEAVAVRSHEAGEVGTMPLGELIQRVRLEEAP
jgi:threonyl-tRNA synthetase